MAVIKKIRIPGYKIIEKENLIPEFHRQNGTFYVFVKQRFTFARLATNRVPLPGIFFSECRNPGGLRLAFYHLRNVFLFTPRTYQQCEKRYEKRTAGHPKQKRYPLFLKLHFIAYYLFHVIIG